MRSSCYTIMAIALWAIVDVQCLLNNNPIRQQCPRIKGIGQSGFVDWMATTPSKQHQRVSQQLRMAGSAPSDESREEEIRRKVSFSYNIYHI